MMSYIICRKDVVNLPLAAKEEYIVHPNAQHLNEHPEHSRGVSIKD